MVLAIAIIYYVVLSVGAGILIKKKVKTSVDFVKSSQGLRQHLVHRIHPQFQQYYGHGR